MLAILGVIISAVGYDSPHPWQVVYGLPFIVGQITYELLTPDNDWD